MHALQGKYVDTICCHGAGRNEFVTGSSAFIQCRPAHIECNRTWHAAQPKRHQRIWHSGGTAAPTPTRQLRRKQTRAASRSDEQQRQSPELQPESAGAAWTGDFQAGAILGGRYRVLDVLGRGSSGVTYKAELLGPDGGGSGRPVAVKALSLKGLKGDWKQLELFEREAQTLEALQHPGIPRYLESFEEDTATDRGYFLVQELVEGKSLAQLVRDGWRGSEEEVKQIAEQLLETLAYLGSRRPPVTHRDIKPDNIVVEGGRPGGRVFLVDFGGVQAAAKAATSANDRIGTTVVGTYGYMAPEQFRGAATPVSDLYGLGGTLLFLLSGKPPSAFPEDEMRLIYDSDLVSDPGLAAALEGLLEPLSRERLPAKDALALLRAPPEDARDQRGSRQQGKRPQLARGQPAGSRSILTRRRRSLELEIPPSGLLSGDGAVTGAFAVAWNGFVAFWTIGALASGGVLMGLFSLPFWAAGFSLARLPAGRFILVAALGVGAFLGGWALWTYVRLPVRAANFLAYKTAFGRSLLRERLKIGDRKWSIRRQLALLKKEQPDWSGDRERGVSGSAKDLSGARVVTTAYVNGVPQTQIELVEGVRKHVFGEGLDLVEQQWLVAQVNEFLENVRGQAIDISPQEDRSSPEDDGDDDFWDGGFGSGSRISGSRLTGSGRWGTGRPGGSGLLDSFDD